MFTCDICDGQNYYEQDGLFYCKECGTQSQVCKQLGYVRVSFFFKKWSTNSCGRNANNKLFY